LLEQRPQDYSNSDEADYLRDVKLLDYPAAYRTSKNSDAYQQDKVNIFTLRQNGI
jgi:hypothetical protein